jgi:hypothetical protein
VTNARGLRAAVRGVFLERYIRMRERGYNFSAHFSVGWGARTVLYPYRYVTRRITDTLRMIRSAEFYICGPVSRDTKEALIPWYFEIELLGFTCIGRRAQNPPCGENCFVNTRQAATPRRYCVMEINAVFLYIPHTLVLLYIFYGILNYCQPI